MWYKKWDIVLVKFPFTDLSNYKLRPALVISNKNFNRDDNLMLVWIYWNKWIGTYSLELKQNDLEEWSIKKKSFFRFHNVFSLHKSLIDRSVAKIEKKVLEKVKNKYCDFMG